MTVPVGTPELLKPSPPRQKDLHAFLQRHLELLARERQAEIDQTSLLASNCSQRELERRGLSLGGLGISNISVGLGGKTLIELHRPQAYHTSLLLPPHTFRTGDPARLETYSVDKDGGGKKRKSASSSKDQQKGTSGDKIDRGVEGVVSRVTPERIFVAVDANSDTDELPERIRLLKLANSATFDRMESTLRHIARIVLNPSFSSSTYVPSPAYDDKLIRVLFGLTVPSSLDIKELKQLTQAEAGPEATEASPIKLFDETLNESQLEAVKFALTAGEVACIHGPPGTGKTFTLVEIIRQLVLVQGKKVLVCGASNLAVDNLLARLSPLFPAGALLRLGHPARISAGLVNRTLDYATTSSHEAEIVKDVKGELEGTMKLLSKKRGDKGFVKSKKERNDKWQDVKELRREYRQREAKVVKNVVAGAQVVLSTCHGAGSRQINNMEFDVCIIDEATQAVEAVCWIPILKAKKLILAGDPLQLPPTILSSNGKGEKVKVKMKPLPLDGRDRPREVTTPLTGAEKPQDAAATPDITSTSDLETEISETQTTKDGEVTRETETTQGPVFGGAVIPGSSSSRRPEVAASAEGTVNPQCRASNDSEVKRNTPQQNAVMMGGVEKTPISVSGGDIVSNPNFPKDLKSETLAEVAEIAEEDQSNDGDTKEDDIESDEEGVIEAMEEMTIETKKKSPKKCPRLTKPRTLEVTLFDRLEKLYGTGIKRMLKVQYRMNETIASFPSTTLYSSDLISASAVAKRRLVDLPGIIDPESDDAQDILSPTVVFFDTAGCEMYERLEGTDLKGANGTTVASDGSRFNENEAEVVAKWVRQLIGLGVPASEIAVITPYQAQVAHIAGLLREDFPDLVVGSVDGMQGQEREAVVLSLVRSNAKQEVGFLAEHRRLNVGMTRAKRQLCVVGDSSTVSKGSKYLKSWMSWLENNADVRWPGDD